MFVWSLYLNCLGLAFKSRPMVRSFAQLSKNDREYGGFNTNDEWMPFPREREGNDYETNWSIVEDGVVSVGDSFRLARLPLLLERIPVKVQQGALELPRPGYVGDYSLTEAGDNITHDDFEAIWKDNVEVLESGSDIFVEDQGLSASTNSRLGGRVITDDPALALILRTLLVSFIHDLSQLINCRCRSPDLLSKLTISLNSRAGTWILDGKK